MVPVPLPPFSHSYTVRARTPSPHQPPSATPSIAAVLHPIHRRCPPPHPSPPSSTMPERLPRPRRPLLEMDVSHPWRRTNSLASRPLASSAPSSSLLGPLTRPSLPPQRDFSPNAPIYRRRSASTPPAAIAPRCLHGAAREVVLHISSTFLSQPENRS